MRANLGSIFGFGLFANRNRNRHEILHENVGLTFVLVQSLKIPFLGSLTSMNANYSRAIIVFWDSKQSKSESL